MMFSLAAGFRRGVAVRFQCRLQLNSHAPSSNFAAGGPRKIPLLPRTALLDGPNATSHAAVSGDGIHPKHPSYARRLEGIRTRHSQTAYLNETLKSPRKLLFVTQFR